MDVDQTSDVHRARGPERILDVAQRRLQTVGFSSFSLADLAGELAAPLVEVERHFPTKTDLGLALLARYTRDFLGALDDIERTTTPASRRLQRYRDIYLDVLEDRRLCLCGMLAAEAALLDPPCRDAVGAFFDHNFAWVERVLLDGAQDGTLDPGADAHRAAESIVSGFEGIMLLAWARHDHAWFELASDHLLSSYAVAPR